MINRVPVSIVTGFLGSGKTTLLNRVLRHPALANAAVIINEFGEIALDHLLIETPAENMVMLASGCICCTVRGDLVNTLRDLNAKREAGTIPCFDRVLVETSGLADPVPILQTLITDAELEPLYRLGRVVTLVDAVHGESQLDTQAEAVKQATLADRLLVTKSDIAPAAGATALAARLARLNPGAELSFSVQGEIEPENLFGGEAGEFLRGDGVSRWLNAERFPQVLAHHVHHDAHEHDTADSQVSAFCIYCDQPVTSAGLVLWLNLLASLRGANLMRVKGLLNVEGKPVVVQAVQTLIHEPVTLERWPDSDRRSRLVFITRNIGRAEIEKTLSALQFDGGSAAPASGFDAAAYTRFVAAVQKFR